nr:MAG TPA: Protein of unknown function (DUF551) [Caudoviricetes sp.]
MSEKSKIYGYIKRTINPYGKPFKGTAYELGVKIMDFIENMDDEKENGWIPVSERLPEDNIPVNITWINRKPEDYYKEIKDVPLSAAGVFFRGKWYWYSATVTEYLREYGKCEWDLMDEHIDVTHWMPFPEPHKEDKP